MYKIIVAAICIILSFASCDKRKDFFKGRNVAPLSTFHFGNPHSLTSGRINGNIVIDTMKFGKEYLFEIVIADENEVECSVNSSFVKLLRDGNYNSFESIKVNGESLLKFRFDPPSVGEFEFAITVKDVFGLENTIKCKIHVFENRNPHLSWSLVHIGNLSSLHKRIIVDAWDKDQLYGGRIIYFQYIINSDTTNNPVSSMDYIFPSAGYYNIAVRAMDDNLEWSNISQMNNFYISN